MSLVIVLTFVVCWSPYYLLGLWYWFSPEMLTREQVPPALSHILFLFGLFNACLDPLVYGLFAVQLRAEGGRGCCCAQRAAEPESASIFTGSFRASTTSPGPVRQSAEKWKCQPESAVAEGPPGAHREMYRGQVAESFI